MKILVFIISFFFLSVSAQSTWQTLSSIPTNKNNQRFDDVYFINDDIGWAANGYYAKVYKTTDGGVNWVEQLSETSLGGNYYFRNIEFLNENIGFLGTLNSEFFKTTDGGTNWTTVENIAPYPPAICGLNTIGDSTIYGCGAYFTPAYIIKSTDKGETWQYIDMSAHANALVEIYFLTENIGFVSGRSNAGATILKTTDGGNTWSEIYNSNIVGEYAWKIQILDNNTNAIFSSIVGVSPNLGKLAKSLDGGKTWSSYDAPETSIEAVGFISETHGWMGGHTTGFYETLNGGESWTNLNIGNNLNRIFVINSSLAYAGGSSIYKYTNETLNSPNIKENSRTPLNIKLKNNPVNTILELNINFNSDDNLLIELYDINGKFIKQLARDQIRSKTEKNYTFPVQNLQAGFYFIRFHNNTGTESLKFIKQ